MPKWFIAEARQRLSELITSSEHAPQSIYKKGRLVAAVVDTRNFEEFQQWEIKQKRLGDAFRTLRRIEEKEGYELLVPCRADRENSFANSLNELSD